MFQDPTINEALSLDKKYLFMETPHAPGVVYAEIGRKAKVYKVKNGGSEYALKAFKPKYRSEEIVENTRRIAKFADVPGLSVADRLIITPDNYPEAIEDHPAFAYAVLMPWIDGMSWFNYVSRRTALKRHESLRLARQFINTVAGLEKKGLAHCDLSSSNFVFSEDFSHVELIDIEDMFGYDLVQPTENPKGTKGYIPNWLKAEGAWEAGADRFAAGILVCEILGWQSEDVRNASSGDTFFADGEFGHKSKRFHLLNDLLKELHPELARLFQAVWYATSLEECPRIDEWNKVLDSLQEPVLDVSPTFLNFGILNLNTSKPVLPTINVTIKNIGDGILNGNIMSNVPWLNVSPSSFSCSSQEISEHTIRIMRNAPHDKKQSLHSFHKGITVRSGDMTKMLDGKYSIQQKKALVPLWAIVVGVVLIFLVSNFDNWTVALAPPSPTPTATTVPTNTLTITPSTTPSVTPSKTPTTPPTTTPSPTPTLVPQSKILFQEDFEDNQISNEWSSVWEIDTDNQGNHFWVATGTYHAYPNAWLSRDNKENWTNYALETKVYIVNGGLFLNVRNSGENSSERYTAWVSEKDNWVSMAQYTYPPSNFAEISGAGTSYQINKNRWYTLRVEINDTHLAFYIDNELVSEVKIPLPVVSTYGSIGFYVTSGDEVYLDDIQVWSFNEINAAVITTTSTPDTQNAKNYVTISCEEDITQVALRKSPGYYLKDDTDIIYKIDCGQRLELLGESEKADGLTWWKVKWDGYIGWMADHTGKGRTVLIFE